MGISNLPGSPKKLPSPSRPGEKGEFGTLETSHSGVLGGGGISKLSRSPFAPKKKPSLSWPVEEGVVIQNFGTQSHPIVRTTKIKSNGVTIATTQTAEARAIFKGIVMTVLSYKGSNPTVLVQHGNYITAYTNLESVYVKKGQNLGAKEKIGRVFTNPNTGKTELKFSIFQSSTPLNPKGWIYRL